MALIAGNLFCIIVKATSRALGYVPRLRSLCQSSNSVKLGFDD
ncbi:hypothetical protein SNOG_05938 [Parastagonospora nodorum SN15]|uniref:Uncharacterized protein n=1 Tax=Phaeosphaeria nodorum (strain SN15 / ATCC MYA-4574 / FGSC 10173) TaxID=321614 RepID=Q0UQM6_PHANO|nr:hypothetical protein SNOG_05938 [Parastagonospora nodorum SN15]EAT87002.1 hypothetical protein SNOG_05938 [Parastagonospora nodorum SN15]